MAALSRAGAINNYQSGQCSAVWVDAMHASHYPCSCNLCQYALLKSLPPGYPVGP